jgi:hypothetical protein
MAARWINQIFGTHYDSRTIRALEDAHIDELLTACKAFEEMDARQREAKQ